MTRDEFLKVVQDVLVLLDDPIISPTDIPNIMQTVQIILQQERKTLNTGGVLGRVL